MLGVKVFKFDYEVCLHVKNDQNQFSVKVENCFAYCYIYKKTLQIENLLEIGE